MKIARETFHKTERLCSVRLISYLFEHGNIFHTPLFKVIWSITPSDLPGPAQAAFSVPKRSFRLAVTRNLIKRRMREAYRKNKLLLYDYLIQNNIKLIFIVIVKGDKIPGYEAVEKSLAEVLKKLVSLSATKHEIC